MRNRLTVCYLPQGRASQPRTQFRGAPSTLLIITALALWSWPAPAQPIEPAVREWSPRVAEALAAYRAGQFRIAQDLAQRVLGLTPRPGPGRPPNTEILTSARERLDAAVIQALCLLHGPGRSERVDGRARLLDLMEYDPSLRAEPECNLAYGIAQTALSETASALDALDRAADGFARAGLSDRLRVTLIELARAWAAHAEWEFTPPRFQIPRPKDSATAVAVRRSQIEAVRARAESLPPAMTDEALADIDLILGRYLLSVEPAREEGRLLLERLCTGGVARAPAAQAALALAEHYEKTARVDAALTLYERVAQEGPAPWSAAAAERHATLTQPELVVETPARAPGGQPVPLAVRARGLERVNLEVRRVDIVAWLQNPQTRGNDSRLPVSGSVRFTRELDTRTPSPLDRWDSDASAEPLQFTAEPGAYVILAEGREVGGREQTVRRLVLIGDLVAVCRISRGTVVVGAAHARASDTITPAAGRVRLWMQGSFVPTEATLDRGVAPFALPNEARLMRDDRWYCVVEAGDEVALCRGRLRDVEGALEPSTQVLMLAGPPIVKPGGDLHVAGLLLCTDAVSSTAGQTSSSPTAPRSASACTLEVLDITDRQLRTAEVPVSGSGGFQVTLPVSPEWAGQHVRVLARVGGRVAENVAGRAVVAVMDTEPLRLHLESVAPTWLRDGTLYLSCSLRATWPWGVPAVGTRTECRLTPVRLPASEIDQAPVAGAPYELEARLNGQGSLELLLPATPAAFGLAPGPLALLLEVQARTSQGWQATALQPVLVGPQPWHAWLTYSPAEPQVGDEVRFTVGYFAPADWPSTDALSVEVRAGEDRVILPASRGTAGFHTPAWLPSQPGTYEAATEITASDGRPLSLRRTVVVHPPRGDPTDAAQPHVTCSAHYATQDGHPVVQIRLTGRTAQPLLISVEGRKSLGAALAGPVAAPLDVTVPVTQAESGARVWVHALGRPELGPLAAANVKPDPAQARRTQLTLRPPQSPIWPGATVEVAATLDPPVEVPPGSVLLARLESLDTQAAATRLIRDTVRRATAPLTLGIAEPAVRQEPGGSWTPPNRGQQEAPLAAPKLPSDGDLWAEVFSTFLSGSDQTVWATAADFGPGGQTLALPIPDQPAMYRLWTVAFLPDGTSHAAGTYLDARRGVSVRVDTPARLSVGDRTVVGVVLRNANPKPVQVELRVHVGNGLHLESWQAAPIAAQLIDADARAAHDRHEVRLMLELPGDIEALVRATVEAFRPGPGTVVAEVVAPDAATRAHRDYEVLDAGPASASAPAPNGAPQPPAVRIRRVLTVWTPEELEELPDEPRRNPALTESKCGHERRWTAAPWSPTDRLRPGQYLQVREEVAPLPEATELIWAQRVPATCVTVRAQPKAAELVAALPSPRADELRFRLNAQPGVPLTHEYYLMVVRPGVCLLPPPVVHSGGAPTAVAVEPAEIQVIAGD